MKTCKNCGAQYSDEALACPNCNSSEITEQAPAYAAYTQAQAAPEKKRMNVFGLVGMIIGIVACLFGGIFGIVVSVVGLVFSAIGMKNAKKCRLNGFAITGLVLSLVSLVYCILYIAVLESIIAGLYGLA